MNQSPSLTNPLQARLASALIEAGGWLPFDRFMALALYEPGLGYYARDSRKLGVMPQSGSDFVTAPELSPLFGQCLAEQVGEALARTGTDEIWEFGAGSGALARQLLQALGHRVARYTIVDISSSLRARQQATLSAFADQVRWVDHLPDSLRGVVVGNEVLDAMPVQLLLRRDGVWHERGVALHPCLADQPAEAAAAAASPFVWVDRPTALRPPRLPEGQHDYLCEIHAQGEAFVRTLAERLQNGAQAAGAVLMIDYGFGESEYYHPQRHMGTLMCHQAHHADFDPLQAVGLKDITAHVNFSGIALAAQDSGLQVLGYTSQARFLFNCGLGPRLDAAPLPLRAQALKLVNEHEMGELFKVMLLATGEGWEALGFAQGDRCHTL
jgi:SAM-dependent MidA family methyltransferase